MDIRSRECYAQPSNGSFTPHEKFCQVVFDGYLCWMATKAGEIAEQPCPDAQLGDGMISQFKATKECGIDGAWHSNSTNYTECDLSYYSNDTAIVKIGVGLDRRFMQMYAEWMPMTKWITYYGYWISLITLLLCVAILVCIKKLHCARNTLHVHLFMSFVLRATSFLIKSALIVDGLAMRSDLVTNSDGDPHYITEHFHWICKAITGTWFYFTQANFMFILMEGIYLHNLMFMNLFSENSSVRIYYLCGWGIPLGFISTWAVLRSFYDNKLCWTTPNNDYIAWLTTVPTDISILINFGLFLSITRILCIKIKSMYVQHNKIKYRRLLRSTLTLMLIYAVPYALSVVCLGVVSYYHETLLELIWICYDQIFSAFQGLFMGLIYCILNGEVRTEIRKIFISLRYHHENNTRRNRATRTISNTMQFTIPITIKEDGEPRRLATTNGTATNSCKSTEHL